MYTLNMSITWDEPTYPNGVIMSYEVTVHQTDNPSVIVYNDDTLTVTSVTPLVMVLPFTDYTVTVAASTSEGQGEGVTIIIESPEAGMIFICCLINFAYVYICFSITEPGPVGNLEASFNTTDLDFDPTMQMYTLDMNITWNEPANPNGVITFYEVTVHQTDNSSVTVYTNATLTVTSVTPSVMVLPFTDYTVTVAASTSAGQGESTSITVESPQAGRGNTILCVAISVTLSPYVCMCCSVFSCEIQRTYIGLCA